MKEGLFRKQVEFLCFEGREALYGGSAGGGKSVAILAAALQFVETPGYAALILRRTFKQLSKADSILAKAKEWLLGKNGVRYNGDDHMFTFPCGATLEFGHMENDNSIFNYQGGSWAFVGVDETTQFTEDMLTYPRTRQRRPVGGKVPIRWRGATNPGGISHEYIKRRYVKDAKGKNPATRDRQFFPATIDDNPHIDREDYIKQLKESGISGLLLDQLLKGDWDAVTGGRFKKEWFEHRYAMRGDYVILARPGVAQSREFRWQECDRFMTVDPNASEKTTSDWTVALVWLKTPQNELLLWDGLRFQADIPDIIPRLESLCRKWMCSGVWIEAVAANNGVYSYARRTTMPAKALSPMGLDKLVRATTAMNLASDGRIWLPLPGLRSALPLEDIEAEWYRFTGDDKKDAHDDSVDCLSYAANILISGPSAAARGAVPIIMGGNL